MAVVSASAGSCASRAMLLSKRSEYQRFTASAVRIVSGRGTGVRTNPPLIPRPRNSRRDVRIAVGVEKIRPVEKVLDIRLNAQALAKREVRGRIRTCVAGERDRAVDRREHVRPPRDAKPRRDSRMDAVVVPQR